MLKTEVGAISTPDYTNKDAHELWSLVIFNTSNTQGLCHAALGMKYVSAHHAMVSYLIFNFSREQKAYLVRE